MIGYYIKYLMGNSRRYIADPEQLKAYQELTKSKTLSDRHIDNLRKLGVEFHEVAGPKEEA